jgi:hypothetical protein
VTVRTSALGVLVEYAGWTTRAASVGVLVEYGVGRTAVAAVGLMVESDAPPAAPPVAVRSLTHVAVGNGIGGW